MTISQVLIRLRAKLNEASAGFYTDDNLYSYLDSGQLEVITMCKSKQDFMRKVDKGYESQILQPLIVPDTNTALSAGIQEYALPSDFLFTHSLLADVDLINVQYRATLVSYDTFLWQENEFNFARATSVNPRYYIRPVIGGAKFGIKPLPSASGTYLHNYYKLPIIVTSGVELTLRPEAHNAIIEFAFSSALEQSSRFQEANNIRQKAITLIKDL